MNGIDMAAVNGVALGSLDSLLAQWLPDGKREGREWVARNPTRSDTHLGSFKINLSTGAWADFATGDKGGDVVSLYAYLEGVKQGEAAGRLAQELGLNSKPYVRIRPDAQAKWTPLTPVPADTPPPPRAHPRHGQPTRVWTYHDAQGAVLCYVYRFDFQGDKQILPLTFCRNTATGQTTWYWQALPSPRPLYNLDKLTASPQATVIICEGEKAAEACSELFPECVITTTLNGAQSPHKTDFSPLQGRTVWIWPDHDGPGRKYTEHVTELLKGIAREVKCLHIPGDHLKGWDAYDALREGWQSSAGYALQDLPQPPLPPVIRGSVAERFKVDDAGVWFHPPEDLAGEDPKPSVWICSPLHVTAYTRNSDGEAWGRLLEFKDAEGQVHTWPMSMEMLAGEGIEYRRMLLSLGLRIAPGRKARDLLTTYIQPAKPPAWARCVERTGWQGDAFVLPDEVIGDTGGERVLLQTVNGSHHVYRQAGTLEDWQGHVAHLCVGNTRLVFSVSCAFASMLLGITHDENGGFHFRGISTQGKTTALAVASSVFGRGEIRNGGYVQTWRATTNGLEAVAAMHNDTLLCLDELKQVDTREAGEIAYMLANGSGKSRADRTGLAREGQTWRILFLSSGEIPWPIIYARQASA